MFADDIVICSGSKEQVEEKLESWRDALEGRGMKVNTGVETSRNQSYVRLSTGGRKWPYSDSD